MLATVPVAAFATAAGSPVFFAAGYAVAYAATRPSGVPAAPATPGTIQSIPTNLVAGAFGFRPPEYFEAAGGERGPAQVRF